MKADPGKFIGVVADTHGILRAEALEALQGATLIIHAGDVGKPEVLAGLQAVAPVSAVRGNVDRGEWAANLPDTQVLEVDENHLYVVHDVHAMGLEPAAAGFQVVISGHSHKPSVRWQEGVLYLNPGSAGPRRFSLPVSLARLRFSNGKPEAELVELHV